MIELIPNLEQLTKEPFDLTVAQAYGVAVEVWLLIVVFLAMLLLTLMNIWDILIRQKRWSVVPLSLFYVLIVMFIVARLLWLYG